MYLKPVLSRLIINRDLHCHLPFFGKETKNDEWRRSLDNISMNMYVIPSAIYPVTEVVSLKEKEKEKEKEPQVVKALSQAGLTPCVFMESKAEKSEKANAFVPVYDAGKVYLTCPQKRACEMAWSLAHAHGHDAVVVTISDADLVLLLRQTLPDGVFKKVVFNAE